MKFQDVTIHFVSSFLQPSAHLTYDRHEIIGVKNNLNFIHILYKERIERRILRR